jgi:hypothetical protein
MAGNTFVTQESTVAFVTSNSLTTVTQVAAVAYVSATFSAWVTQVSVVAYVWESFNTQVTQQPTVAWVITCDSTSYVPPAGTDVITLAITTVPGVLQASLSWTAVDGFSYEVQRGLSSGTETTLVSGLTMAAYVDASIMPGVTYFYRVIGTNPCLDTTTSNEVSVMVAGVLVPQPPGTTIDPLPPDATCCDGMWSVGGVPVTAWTAGPGCSSTWTPATPPATTWTKRGC